MSNYASRADLQVAQPIIEFAEQTAERHGFDLEQFWVGVSAIVHDLAP